MYESYLKKSSESFFRKLKNPISHSWIHVHNATINDVLSIAQILNIDPEDIKDSLDMLELARIEKIDQGIFVLYVRFPHMQEVGVYGVYTVPLTIILSEKYLVTICPATCHIIEKILTEKNDLATNLQIQLLIFILFRIVQEYTKVLRTIRASILTQEKDMRTLTDKEIIALTQKEENLSQCLHALQLLREEVIEGILSGKYEVLNEKERDLFEDLFLSIEQAEEMCHLNLRIISSLRNSVQIIITNQFNETIRFLTALTIIVNIPGIISSIYGMNVHLPLTSNTFAFWVIMGFIVGISSFAYFFFKRKKWL